MARTYQQQLDDLDVAIAAIESGQVAEYEIAAGGDKRRFSKLDLATLYAERRRLEGLAAKEARGGRIGIRHAQPRSA